MGYLNGGGSYKCLAERYGIASKTDVKKWIDNYRGFGDDGLIRSRKNDIYSFEKKLFIVESYLTSEVSYHDLVLLKELRRLRLEEEALLKKQRE